MFASEQVNVFVTDADKLYTYDNSIPHVIF